MFIEELAPEMPKHPAAAFWHFSFFEGKGIILLDDILSTIPCESPHVVIGKKIFFLNSLFPLPLSVSLSSPSLSLYLSLFSFLFSLKKKTEFDRTRLKLNDQFFLNIYIYILLLCHWKRINLQTKTRSNLTDKSDPNLSLLKCRIRKPAQSSNAICTYYQYISYVSWCRNLICILYILYVPFYIVSYYIKGVTTSWTHGTYYMFKK